MKIKKGDYSGVNAAIILSGTDNKWEIPKNAILNIDAPVRAHSKSNEELFKLEAEVYGHLIFDEHSNIYGEGSLQPIGRVLLFGLLLCQSSRKTATILYSLI